MSRGRKLLRTNKTYICLYCKKEFVRCVIPSSDKCKYCSLKCFGLSQRIEFIKNCIVCGKDFIWRQHSKTTGKFCSKLCSNIGKRWPGIKKICPNCKIEFVSNSNKQKYCSSSCSATIQHKINKCLKLRFMVLKRDGFRCQYCGRSISEGVILNVDHIYPKSKGGKYIAENLITSCQDCNIGKGTIIL